MSAAAVAAGAAEVVVVVVVVVVVAVVRSGSQRHSRQHKTRHTVAVIGTRVPASAWQVHGAHLKYGLLFYNHLFTRSLPQPPQSDEQ